MSRRIRWRRGMTMVEIVVALAVAAVLMAATSALLMSSLNNYARVTVAEMDRQLADNSYDFIYRNLRQCSWLAIGGGAAEEGNSIYVEEGRLFYRRGGEQPLQIYDDELYNGRELSYQTSLQGDCLYLTVTMSADGQAVYQRASAFRLLNVFAPTGAQTVLGETGEISDAALYFN